jgi:hypothetical protein
MRGQSLASEALPNFALVLVALPALPPLALVSSSIADSLRSHLFFQAPLSPVSERLTSIALFSLRLLAHYYADLSRNYGLRSVLRSSFSSSIA